MDVEEGTYVKGEIDRATNTVRIEGNGVRDVVLYLNDVLVDMGQPLKVVLNGEEQELLALLWHALAQTLQLPLEVAVASPPRAAQTEAQRHWLAEHFEDEIVSVLSPTTLDPTRPIPRILNKSLNFIVRLKGRDAYGRRRHRGMVQAPRSLPRRSFCSTVRPR